MSKLRNLRNNIRSYTWKRLVWSLVIVALSLGVISAGAKFAAFWNHWVYFPWWPNIADSTLLIVVGVCLLAYMLRDLTKDETRANPQLACQRRDPIEEAKKIAEKKKGEMTKQETLG